VIVDSEDAERVRRRIWKAIPGPTIGAARFITDLGMPGRPAYQLLAGFIMQAPVNKFVEQRDRSPSGLRDYRKKNLRVQ
jgi:hypothetical protein